MFRIKLFNVDFESFNSRFKVLGLNSGFCGVNNILLEVAHELDRETSLLLNLEQKIGIVKQHFLNIGTKCLNKKICKFFRNL